ncbi:hypothetical protein [Helicobacter sp. T3_23-1056]
MQNLIARNDGNTNFHNDGIIPPPLVENFAFCPPSVRRGLGGG